MASRHHAFYPQCLHFDGIIPDAPGPQAQRNDLLHNYTRRGNEPVRRPWRPSHCTFTRLADEATGLSNIYGTIDLDIAEERLALARQYRCTKHNIVPVLWARRSAFVRRSQPLIEANWILVAETLRWETAAGDPRQTTVNIWHRRRPPPKTMHTAWNQLARA